MGGQVWTTESDGGRQNRMMDHGRWFRTTEGFWTADRRRRTAKVILADGPIPWLSSRKRAA